MICLTMSIVCTPNVRCIYIVTCTAFPYVTLHSQPFPKARLVAVLCYTCYFVPPNGLNRRAAYSSAHLRRSLNYARVTVNFGHTGSLIVYVQSVGRFCL